MKAIWLAEFLGTTFLLMIVVGSGIMAEQLAQGNLALALLINSLVSGAGLFVLIRSLNSISGSHLNPVVSLAAVLWGKLERKKLMIYWSAQLVGSILGVLIVHQMFNLDILQISLHERAGNNLWFSEMVASFGLICIIGLAGKKDCSLTVASYITAAYWFTSSSSFANPALTIARMFTNTYSGITPGSAIPFILAQFMGTIMATLLIKKAFKFQKIIN